MRTKLLHTCWPSFQRTLVCSSHKTALNPGSAFASPSLSNTKKFGGQGQPWRTEPYLPVRCLSSFSSIFTVPCPLQGLPALESCKPEVRGSWAPQTFPLSTALFCWGVHRGPLSDVHSLPISHIPNGQIQTQLYFLKINLKGEMSTFCWVLKVFPTQQIQNKVVFYIDFEHFRGSSV